MPKKIEISHRTIVFTVLFLGGLWLLLQIKSIILTLFVTILLTTAINPVVERLVRFKLPRGLAILLVYITLISAISAGLASIISPLVAETTNFANRVPELLDQLGSWLEDLGVQGIDNSLITAQFSRLGTLPANIVTVILAIFSNLLSVVTVLVLTFYMLLERRNLDKYLLVLFGGDGERQAKTFVDKIEARLGGWVRGELILMIIIGSITYVGLRLLGVPYALPLAIIAGVLEILPNIGPIISAIPAILVGFTVSPIIALGTAALYFVIQQLENTLIAPKVMQKAAGVNPLVTILSLAIGFQLAGAIGAILAVPIVIVLQVVLSDVFGFQSVRNLS